MHKVSMIRVDERLVHGQIIIKWLEREKAKRIIIIDDEADGDIVLEKILRMTLPDHIKLNIFNLEDGIEFLLRENAVDNAIVLVKDLLIVKKIHEKGVGVKEINIGRIPAGLDKQKVHPNVFLSDKDMKIIEYFKDRDVPLIIQMVPDSEAINLYDLDF